jgi:hypothetical protein
MQTSGKKKMTNLDSPLETCSKPVPVRVRVRVPEKVEKVESFPRILQALLRFRARARARTRARSNPSHNLCFLFLLNPGSWLLTPFFQLLSQLQITQLTTCSHNIFSLRHSQ